LNEVQIIAKQRERRKDILHYTSKITRLRKTADWIRPKLIQWGVIHDRYSTKINNKADIETTLRVL